MEKRKENPQQKDKRKEQVKIALVPLGSVAKLTGGFFSSGEAEYRNYYPKSDKS